MCVLDTYGVTTQRTCVCEFGRQGDDCGSGEDWEIVCFCWRVGGGVCVHIMFFFFVFEIQLE